MVDLWKLASEEVFGIELVIGKEKGVLKVGSISPNTPASRTPLREGNVLLRVDDASVEEDREAAIRLMASSNKIRLYYRDEEETINPSLNASSNGNKRVQEEVEDCGILPLKEDSLGPASLTTPHRSPPPIPPPLSNETPHRVPTMGPLSDWREERLPEFTSARETVKELIQKFLQQQKKRKRSVTNISADHVNELEGSLWLAAGAFEEYTSRETLPRRLHEVSSELNKKLMTLKTLSSSETPIQTPKSPAHKAPKVSLERGSNGKVIEVVSLLSDDEEVEEKEEILFPSDWSGILNDNRASDRKTRHLKQEDDEGVSFVAPVKSVPIAPTSSSSSGALDDDGIEFVGGSFESSVHMPHQREACSVYPFKPGTHKTNKLFCAMCYCYICDIKAEGCPCWAGNHCDATTRNALHKKEKEVVWLYINSIIFH